MKKKKVVKQTAASDRQSTGGVAPLEQAAAGAQIEEQTEQDSLKRIGGSDFLAFNTALANQTVHSTWTGNSDDEDTSARHHAAIHGMIGISPRDEIEGMLAAQMTACHNASMECFRRAMLPNQPLEGRNSNLSHAGRLSRTFSTLLEALNRHRGKGQQKMTVEHVHVHDGGKAIVGNVRQGGGSNKKS